MIDFSEDFLFQYDQGVVEHLKDTVIYEDSKEFADDQFELQNLDDFDI